MQIPPTISLLEKFNFQELFFQKIFFKFDFNMLEKKHHKYRKIFQDVTFIFSKKTRATCMRQFHWLKDPLKCFTCSIITIEFYLDLLIPTKKLFDNTRIGYEIDRFIEQPPGCFMISSTGSI